MFGRKRRVPEIKSRMFPFIITTPTYYGQICAPYIRAVKHTFYSTSYSFALVFLVLGFLREKKTKRKQEEKNDYITITICLV